MNLISSIYDRYLQSEGVLTDSRKIQKNHIFFALKGPSFDGNRFAESALRKGACYAVVDDRSLEPNDKLIFVNDVLESLQELAHFHRRKLSIPVIGITGSNGKTTTKELIKAVLDKKYRVSATKGNLNNHIGVPLTLLNADRNSEILIVEMGSNQPGDIEFLCKIAEPDYGLITNIGKSHLEKLRSLEGVFEEKRSLYDFTTSSNGHFFLNTGDSFLKDLKPLCKRCSFYSDHKGPYGTLAKEDTGESPFLRLLINHDPEQFRLSTHISGDYNLENISAALTLGHSFQIGLKEMIAALEEYIPGQMRSQLVRTRRNRVLLDAYNANPTSMKASIESAYKRYPSGLVLILGDMLELGPNTDQYHWEMLSIIDDLSFRDVFLVGEVFSKVANESKRTFINVDALIESGELLAINECNVLVKGSRGIRLERTLDQL